MFSGRVPVISYDTVSPMDASLASTRSSPSTIFFSTVGTSPLGCTVRVLSTTCTTYSVLKSFSPSCVPGTSRTR